MTLNGYDVWLDDEKLLPGQEWALEIHRAVRESEVVLVCLSNDTVSKSGYVQKEIRLALDVADEQPEGTIFLIPLRLENCIVPMRLRQWHWVDLFSDNGYRRLLQSLDFRAESIGLMRMVPNKPNMVFVPEGHFLMGITPENARQVIETSGTRWKRWLKWEQPQHEVELSEYFIGKYLVTNLEYQLFVQDTGQHPPENWINGKFPLGKGRHPVVYVSWENVVAYCQWLTAKLDVEYRLPTEAEWEKASRGENANIYPWGELFDVQKANTKETGINDTTPVGQFSPQGDSPYGCADMAGNVYEWCLDSRNSTTYLERTGVVKDPLVYNSDPSVGKIMRGGSYGIQHASARCTYRNSSTLPSRHIGFRIVHSKIPFEI